MKNQLNLVINGKGGVGKSFFAVNFVQYLKDRQVPHLAFDTDNENSTLKRFHPDATFLNLGRPRDLDAMFHALEKHPLVVVDCRAASTGPLFDYFAEVAADEVLRHYNASLTLIMPVNHEADSVDQVQRIVDKFGSHARYVIIRNAVHTESFTLYDESEVRDRLMNQLQGCEIVMSRLQGWLVEALNMINLTPAVASRDARFSILDRQRLSIWQRHLYDQMNSAAELLLPGGVKNKSDENHR